MRSPLSLSLVLLLASSAPAGARRIKVRPAPPPAAPLPTLDSEPPPDTSRGAASAPAPGPAPASAPAPAPVVDSDGGDPEKAGRFMANLRIGPAVLMDAAPHAMFSVVAEVAIALLGNTNGYLFAPLTIQATGGITHVMIPVGFQYDIKLPIKGLYLAPRVSLGYAAAISSGAQLSATQHGGVLTPEFGVKYVWRRRFNFGGEPLSIPILLFPGNTYAYYRILGYAGLNF